MAHPTILSLFSGVGGLDLGIQIACPGARVLGYVERDAYAATVLMARMEDESLERAPVFIGDIQNLDGSELRGRVEILCGGFPCQDISVAGKGVGIGGKRSGLWSEIVRLADEIRPRYIFLENVSAIITQGLDVVLADLAALGFDAEWLCLRASDVGAPHRRERWFCLAHAARTSGQPRPGRERVFKESENVANAELAGVPHRRERWFCLAHRDLSRCEVERFGGVLDGERTTRWNDAKRCGETMAHAERTRRVQAGERRELNAGREPAEGCSGMDDADSEGLQRRDQRGAGGFVRAAGSFFPPGPADHDAWRRILEQHPHLAPAVESGVRVLVDGTPVVLDESRADQLRCCGNGVVPLQAAVAFRELLERSLT